MDWERIGHGVERLIASQRGLCVCFSFNGTQYWGARTSLRREDVNADAGLAEYYRFSLLCPSGQFTGRDLPQPRTDKIVLDGLEYRVLGVERDAVDATIRIHLGEALA